MTGFCFQRANYLIVIVCVAMPLARPPEMPQALLALREALRCFQDKCEFGSWIKHCII